ncbi:hypothetical protein BM526_15420 [Alteromonas mediterranea]|uniref:hypothetical protein n=1 Tax=Alteromonas mediterranea TaxID=314275 RepID=UPI000903A44C|nr:hypothetical protein [Alteromonas mediterranea]APE03116.1 hypothetical protein BM526_15420 [Alteromonas mediterranea]|tara:strand:+ start:2901 stop:3854 length:954 start_codon:yes stop_codon:yes gene_type:complete
MIHIKRTTVIALIYLLFGCSGVYHKPDVGDFDVRTTPSFSLLEASKATNTAIDDSSFDLTDRQVYKFTYLLQDTMRKRVDHGRKWEEGLSALQVVFAAFASAFSASTGVHPDVVTTLAGLSALTPDIENIINAGGKARAYSQALDLVEKANATYVRSRAEVASGKDDLIPKEQLSPQGAQLFVSVMATLKIMRDSLLETIPDQEDIAKATGNYELFRLNTNNVDIKVDSSKAKFVDTVGDTSPFKLKSEAQKYHKVTLSLIKGKEINRCSSSAESVAVVSCTGDKVNITPLQEGKTKITVVNDSGNIVSVTAAISIF